MDMRLPPAKRGRGRGALVQVGHLSCFLTCAAWRTTRRVIGHRWDPIGSRRTRMVAPAAWRSPAEGSRSPSGRRCSAVAPGSGRESGEDDDVLRRVRAGVHRVRCAGVVGRIESAGQVSGTSHRVLETTRPFDWLDIDPEPAPGRDLDADPGQLDGELGWHIGFQWLDVIYTVEVPRSLGRDRSGSSARCEALRQPELIGVRGFAPTWNEICSPSASTMSINTKTSAWCEEDDIVRWAAMWPTRSTPDSNGGVRNKTPERPGSWSSAAYVDVASSLAGSCRATPVEASRCRRVAPFQVAARWGR